ncbi:Nuc-1 negative regulatory protein preg [Mycena indigotica]|uniref:Nuc-1 negative regulatory protein preg n=1 Tax=Mycena indigotica TaxID=2126181 RepID=A0A8H6TB53_9AGAR|nr:Nuc-1 negative regulatory protein preg [Mycena indigotica]KAF7315268.1 Nuc-1 negative regulatory protein preg [Mycena indigotica]
MSEELPLDFAQVPMDILVILIADMLDRLMAHNDLIPLLPESLTRFHSRTAPSISVLDYLRRIVRYTNVEKSCLLLTLHYIDQICARMPRFTLSSLTCHRFIIASITVSSKGLCDTFCTNNLYAKVGGISVSELNVLEREFLDKIDWRIMCTRDLLQEYYVNLVRTHTSGKYYVIGTQSSVGSASDDGDEMDTTQSRPPTPAVGSAILIDLNRPVEVKPTIEQNMAFAALQELDKD